MSEPHSKPVRVCHSLRRGKREPQRRPGRREHAPGRPGDRPGPCHRRLPEAEDPQLCGDRQRGRRRLPHLRQRRRPPQPQRRRGLCRSWTSDEKTVKEKKKKPIPTLDRKHPGLDVRQLLRHPHLWRCDDHLRQGRPELRTGPRPRAAGLCPQRGAHRPPGSHHHPGGHYHRERMQNGRAPRWAASTSSPMAFTAARAMSPPTWPERPPVFRRRTCLCCGKPS